MKTPKEFFENHSREELEEAAMRWLTELNTWGVKRCDRRDAFYRAALTGFLAGGPTMTVPDVESAMREAEEAMAMSEMESRTEFER